MDSSIKNRIIAITSAKSITSVHLVQPLWNNYGTLTRLVLTGSIYKSVILKHIKIPSNGYHPKGFGGSFSRNRKIKSYQVEQSWYQQYNKEISSSLHCPTPNCIDSFRQNGEVFLLLEDIDNRGYTKRLFSASKQQIDITIRWLAYFHAHFLSREVPGLWETGTYWHLATRPEEYENISNTQLLWCEMLCECITGDYE